MAFYENLDLGCLSYASGAYLYGAYPSLVSYFWPIPYCLTQRGGEMLWNRKVLWEAWINHSALSWSLPRGIFSRVWDHGLISGEIKGAAWWTLLLIHSPLWEHMDLSDELNVKSGCFQSVTQKPRKTRFPFIPGYIWITDHWDDTPGWILNKVFI